MRERNRCLLPSASAAAVPRLVVGLLVTATLVLGAEEERLIGWQGETYTPGFRGGIDPRKEAALVPSVEVLSWSPRAFIFHNFLTPKECLYLIQKAAPTMVKSTVVNSATGRSKDSRMRTSSGTFLRRGEDEVIRTIEERIAHHTFVPVDHGEGFQVLHYARGQKYDAHNDFFHDEWNTRNGGQRLATMLMYLTDVEIGGETVFPAADANVNQPGYDELSKCGKAGVGFRPKRGDAILFWSMKPDATLDQKSLHAGCPVIKGNKWSATKWMRVHPYRA
eukprot:TRINITY_DN35827_c0_g1_i1.p1 TRINITY_DN35827_c0_g1~~TRINITY_DN35827_c0_g1_i1.p1  ORF type:complete len:278 (-),score=42.73 TRINITY_DN35827_c0_g1_i1:390-1223(-)